MSRATASARQVVLPPATYVVAPVRDRLDLTKNLVAQLCEHGGFDEIFVFDNGSLDATLKWLRSPSVLSAGVMSFARPEATIYEMWQEGLELSRKMAPKAGANVAFLNNDIAFGPRFLQRMSRALRGNNDVDVVYPDWNGAGASRRGTTPTTGTAADGGMCGFAFMVRAERCPDFDTRYQIWAGDDDLVAAVIAAGHKVARVNGLSCEHLDGGSQTVKTQMERGVNFDFEADLALFAEKWGRSPRQGHRNR